MKFLDATIIQSTNDMSHKGWLMARKNYIGGSESSAIIGINPFRSSIDVYMDKITDEIIENKSYRMELGNKLEDFVAREFMEKTGKKVRNVNAILGNEKYPYMSANIDRAIVGEKSILECKVTNSFAIKEWEDDKVPPYYEIQVQHYMAITGAEKAYIAALIGNSDFAIKEIVRDDELIEMIVKANNYFWTENVQKKILPSPDGTSMYDEVLKEKYKYSKENQIILQSSNDERIQNILDIKEQIDILETEKKKLEQEVKSELGENESGICNKFQVNWKGYVTNRIDTTNLKKEMPEVYKKYCKESYSRKFTIKAI